MRLWRFGAEINEALKAKLPFEEIPSEHEINCMITNCVAEKTSQKESIENVYPVIKQKLART
jgi:hypothetical protein